jgi:NAD dependent epimerase/dehydratase
MKILVTGAGGFIGSHLVEALLGEGHEVRALVRYNSRGSWGHLGPHQASPNGQLEVQLGDVADAGFVRGLVAGCDRVCHLAALIGIPYSYHAPGSYLTTNVGGTLAVLDACRDSGVGRVIITSTSEVYGTARYAPIDEAHPLQGQSPYSASKIAADKFGESYHRSFGLPVVTLRPFNTYGPRQSARAIIPTVLTQALAGASEIRLGNLEPKRDLTFVDDTARAFVLALSAPGIDGQVIHFGEGRAISIGELAQKCLDVVGSDARITPVADRQRPVNSEVELLLCDPSRARELLGWEPRVSLDEGLRRTAEYLRAHLAQYDTSRYAV